MPTAFTHDPNMGIPSSTTNTGIARWSGTSGGTLLSSGITIDNSNVMAGITSLTVDNLNLNGNTISSTAGTDLFITPLGGQQLILDGTIIIDAGVVTGATSITSTEFVGGGVSLTALNGSAITSGTVPAARLGSGSPGSGNFLRGDGSWQAVAGGGAVSAVANGSDNRIATFSSSDALNGEANFTFDNWPVVKRSAGTGDTFVMEGFNDANYHTRLVIRKSQHDTIDTMTVVDGDQTIGEISFQGASGTSAGNWGTGAQINVSTDATVGDAWSGNDCPAIMRFWTCPDGGSEPLQRIILRSNGMVGIGAHNHGPSVFGTLHVKTGDSGYNSVYAESDDFIIEGSTHTGMTISAPNASTNFFCLATPSGGTQTSGFYMSYNSGSEYFAIMNAGGEKWKVADTGNVTGAHGTYHVSSDERIKENVVGITYGLDAVMGMRPVEYDFCDWYDTSIPYKTRLGFIAQEVKAVVPEIVNIATIPVTFEYKADDDTPVVETHETIEDMHSIEDQQMIPILVKAIQELNAKIDALGI